MEKTDSVPLSTDHDELRQLIKLIEADVSGRAMAIFEFIREALLAGKPEADIVTALRADVLPLEGDRLTRHDLLPAYVRMGLISRAQVRDSLAQMRIGGAVADVMKKITGN